MADLIDRAALRIDVWERLSDAVCALVDAPTIEAEPVKHGRWLPQILLGEKVWDCSECKTIGSPVWKRCPVCEAKMDLEADNDRT